MTVPPDASGITLRDGSTGAVIAHSTQPTPLNAVAAGRTVVIGNSPDGRLLALDPSTVQLAGPPFPAVRGHLDSAAALSADERRLLVVGVDHAVRVHDVASRTQLGDEIDSDAHDGAALRHDVSKPRQPAPTASSSRISTPTTGPPPPANSPTATSPKPNGTSTSQGSENASHLPTIPILGLDLLGPGDS